MLFFHNVLLFFLHNVELLCWQKAVSSSSSWWRWWQTFDKCFTPIFLQILGFKKSFVSAVYKLFQDYESFDKSFYLHILFIYQTRDILYRAEFWYRNIIKKILIKETSRSFLNVTSHAEELFGEIKIPLESAKMNKKFYNRKCKCHNLFCPYIYSQNFWHVLQTFENYLFGFPVHVIWD